MRSLTLRRLAAVLLLLTCMLGILPQAGAVADPDIAATAVYLGDPITGLPLYEKNAEERRFPASTTKIMTALVVLDNMKDLSQKVTVTEADLASVPADGSKAGFVVGEEVSVLDLLYGLLLPSGNEAANTLARFVAGSEAAFVDKMNARALELGCTGTHFENAHGLHDENHYTTAHDLFRMTQEALKNETFAEIVNTAQKNLAPTNKASEHPNGKNLYLLTTNQLILSSGSPYYYAYAKGVKTGHTSQAGYCLVASATKKKSTLISVVLGCERPKGAAQPLSFTETRKLFEWGYENFSAKTLIERGAEIREVPVRLSTDTDKLMLVASDDLRATVANDSTLEDFEQQITVPDDVTAPITAGQKIGSLALIKDGITYGTVDLLALSDIALSEVLYYADLLENFFRSGLFKIILVVLLLLLLFYVSVYIIRERRRRERRRAMMRSKRARMEQYERDQRRDDHR